MSGLENKPLALRASLLGDARQMRVIEARERLVAHLLEERPLVGGNRLATLALERELRIVRDAVDADLEVQMWSGGPTRHTDVADRRAHRDVHARPDAGGEVPHVAV